MTWEGKLVDNALVGTMKFANARRGKSCKCLVRVAVKCCGPLARTGLFTGYCTEH